MTIDNIFSTILGMSLVGSATIIAVLILRAVMNKLKLAAKWKYVLWTVVLFRLLCPVSISTPISLMHDSTTAYTRVKSAVVKQDVTASHDAMVNDATTVNQAAPISQTSMVDQTATTSQATSEATSIHVTPRMVIVAIWILGIFIMLAYALYSNAKLKKHLIGSVKCAEYVYECDYITTAFVKGIFKPTIYIPSNLSEEKRQYIILHELTHLKRGDAFTRILAYIALSIHWFNPLCWIAFLMSETDMEMSCDERVLKTTSGDIRASYARAIFDMALGRQYSLQMPLSFGKGNTKERIVNIMNKKNNNKLLSLAVAPVIATLLIACGTNAATSDVNPEVNTEAVPNTEEGSTKETTTEVNNEVLSTQEPQETATEATPTGEENADTAYIPEVSKEGLTDWACDSAFYGFLLSSYDDPRECDYSEVFYCGAGIEAQLTDADNDAINEYWASIGSDNPEIDATLIRKKDMDKFLMTYVGITSDEIKEDKQFGIYLKSIDSSFFCHGDTNYVTFECLGFEQDGDIIRADFQGGYDEAVRHTVLKVTDNGFQIMENHIE